jgi:hypothetical protein
LRPNTQSRSARTDQSFTLSRCIPAKSKQEEREEWEQKPSPFSPVPPVAF